MSASHRVRSLGLFLGALWLRYSWMGEGGARHKGVDPGSLRSVRRVFDGHERLYFAAFTGDPPDPSPQAWPAGLWLWQALGWLSQDPRLLLGVSAVAGALGVVVLERWVRRERGARAGAWAGLLACLLPAHVVWSTSAVPVALAATLMLLGLTLRSRGWSMVAMVAAVLLRPELAVLGLLRGALGIAPVLAGGLVLLGVGRPPGAPVGASILGNILMVDFVAPFGLLVGALLGRWRRPWVGVGLAWVAFVGFADLGPRHLLVAGLLVAGLAGAAVGRWGRWLGLLVVVSMLGELGALRAAWHRPAPRPPGELAAVGQPEAPPVDCIEVSGEPPIPGQPIPSHLTVPAGGCRVWGMAPEHTAWSSRGLRARARRMRRRYGGEVVAAEVPGHGRPWRVWIRLGDGRPW